MRFHLLFFAVVFSIVFPAAAPAHGVHARASLHGGQVKVKVFFDGGGKAPRAKVAVKNADGEVVAAGETDREGHFLFPLPAPGAYSIRADAGAGHVTTLSLTVRTGGEIDASTAGAQHREHPPAVEVGQPEEEEVNAFPWAKVGIGLGAIGLLTAALLIAVRQKRAEPRKP